MELDFIIVVGAAAVFYNTFVIYLLWRAVRSLMKKNLNLPPCKRRWAKVKVEIVSEKEMENPDVSETSLCDETISHFTGKRYSQDVTKRTTKYSNLRYVYEGKSYQLKTTQYSSGYGGTELYCRKDNPAITKWFSPKPALSFETAIALLFIACAMIFFEIMIFI